MRRVPVIYTGRAQQAPGQSPSGRIIPRLTTERQELAGYDTTIAALREKSNSMKSQIEALQAAIKETADDILYIERKTEMLREKMRSKPTDAPDVRIYVLCHTQERYEIAIKEFGHYYWAVPLLMKYQDSTLENACWKQLEELEHEWKDCDMVGTLSSISYKKVNLIDIDSIIMDRSKWIHGYYHFMLDNKPITNERHPHLLTIVKDICRALGYKIPLESYCNYWMCRPRLMTKFIKWVTGTLIPLVLEHPLIMEDAYYKESKLSEEECNKIWGKPYYPHIPFVIERLTYLFFSKKIILVSHENTLTGAPLILEELQRYFLSQEYIAELIYYSKNTTKYLLEEATRGTVIVVSNTLVTQDVVLFCNANKIPVIWYIHEWLDSTVMRHYPFLVKDKNIYRYANKLVFPCIGAYNNHNEYSGKLLSDISTIIPYGYNLDLFRDKKLAPAPFEKAKGTLYIGIIGTIDKRKNQSVFIQNVFKPLQKKYPHICLVLIGKKNENINPPIGVTMVGCVTNPISYINLMDIIVSYSTNEVLPLNLIEASLCRKAIVTSDAGGSSDIITDCSSGFVVGINDHAAAIKRLSELIESPSLRYACGSAAYDHAIMSYNQVYNFSSFEHIIDDVYNELESARCYPVPDVIIESAAQKETHNDTVKATNSTSGILQCNTQAPVGDILSNISVSSSAKPWRR